MIKRVSVATVFLFVFAHGVLAQSITNYTFSAYSGTFNALTGATTPNLSSGTTDEGYVNGIPIGFDFWYMGTRYTTIAASSNGWLAFGGTITNPTPVNSLTSGGAPRPLVAPLWNNLDLAAATKIAYVTTGSVGTRVFSAQYLNTKWQAGANGNTMSFQVKLYEGTGKIEFIYRQESGSTVSPSASIGIAGTLTGPGQFLSVTNNGTTVSSITESTITSKPITGNTYAFTPPVPNAPAGLIFSAVSSSSMTLNWSDASTSETGFVIYRSTDGTNYSFVSQVAANVTSSLQSGLTPTTLYYWKVYSLSEGALSSTALSGSNTTTCVQPAAPVVTSPVNYCLGASAVALTATGTNLQWGGTTASVVGGTATLSNTTYVDNSSNNKRTKFTTTTPNVTIKSVDYNIPPWQLVSGLVLSIYNSSGIIIATSSTSTTQLASASTILIRNIFNYTIITPGDYSIGISSGFGNVGYDSPAFPLTESTGTINVTGVTTSGVRCFNDIQFSVAGTPTAPVPSTAAVGSTSYQVTQTVSGCASPPATIVVNVASPNISQIPAAGLIGNYKFNGNANDENRNNDGSLQGAPSLAADRFNNANKAYSFNGSSQYVSTTKAYVNPTSFTVSIWFKTSTSTGGKLIGFGTSQAGASGQYDRHLYMSNSGQIYFGVYSGTVFTVNSALSYNDNRWHLATGTLSPATGMALYIDGVLVDSNTGAAFAENYTGYWRIGYDNINGWTSQPTSFFFNGALDDALIYTRALTSTEVNTIYVSPDGAGNNGPACVGSPVTLSATTIPGATYSWSGPGSYSSSTQNPSFTYSTSNAGVYTLVVTASGCTATAYTNLATTTTAGQWTGNVSTDWATAGNWCAGAIPTATTNVIIPASASRMPTINGSVTCNNLTINSAATLTIASAGTLNIAGLLTNSGTINNTGTVNFNGSSGQQTFSGVSSFYNLTVSNTSGVILPAAINVVNNLNLTSGSLNSNGFNISVGGNWINNLSTSAFNALSGTVTFNGSAPQALGGTFSTTFNSLVISNTASTVTLGNNISVNGNLSVTSGTFNLATFTANRSGAGGILAVSNNALLRVGGSNSFPSNYSTVNLSTASTVEYSGTNQNVSNQTYGNLSLTSSSGAAVKTFPGTAMTIIGSLSSNIASGTSVSFTASAPVSISGSVTIGGSTTFNAGSYAHTVGGSWVNNGVFNGNTSTVTFVGEGTSISGPGTQNFNNVTVTASQVSLPPSLVTISGNLSTSGPGSITQASGGTVSMTGTGNVISGQGISLENLDVTGTISTTTPLSLSGNLSVSGSFTTGAGVFGMSGSSKTISGAGTKNLGTVLITGSITALSDLFISSNLTANGSFIATAGTTTFTGTSTLSGEADLFNVNINGTSLQLSSNSTLGIAGALTIAAGTIDVTTAMPNTVMFNSTGAQNINPISYYNLLLSNGNNKTALGAITVVNDITIGTGTTFIAGSFTHSVSNNWNNNGAFTPGTGTIQFLTTDDSNISGATTFNNLTVNAASAVNNVFLLSDVTAATVNMTNGVLLTGTNTLTITNTRTGNGKLRGTITRTHSFTTGVPYAFESPNNSITFSSVSGVSSITLYITQDPVADFPFGNSVNEEYDVTISGTYVATLSFDYNQDDLNGNDENTMVLWHYNGTSWASAGKTSNDTTLDYVALSGITNLNGRWTLSGSINTVTWNGSVSSDWNTAGNWTVVQGAPSTPPSSADVVELGAATFTNNPIITSSVVAKNIRFGSTQAITLSLNAGGSLQVYGNIDGDWTSNAVHTINVGNQTLTIAENLDLSDDVVGQSINLNIGSGSVNVLGTLFHSGDAAVTFSSSGTLSISGHFQYDGGVFLTGTGTVIYNGTDNQDIANITYYNLVINKSSLSGFIDTNVVVAGNMTVQQGTVINKGTTTINGDVTIASGAVLQNDNTLHVGGNWNNSGTFQGDGISVIFDGPGSQTISATTFNNAIFNKPVGSVAQLTGDVVINGDLTVTSGTVDIRTFNCNRSVPGGIATLADNGTFIIGANNPPINFSDYILGNSSTVIFNGTTAQSITLPDIDFGNIIFRNAGVKTLLSPATLNGDLTIESPAIFDAGSSTLILNGNWINNGTFIPSSSTVICNGTGKQISGNTTFNQLTIYGSYTILNNTTFNGLLNITSSGSLSGGGSVNTTLNGDLINSGVLYTLGTTTFTGTALQTLSLINAVQTVAVTVNFNGSISPVLHSTSMPQFGYLNVNNTGGVNPSVDWVIQYSLTVGSGASFNAGATTQTIYGDVNNNGAITTSGSFNFLPVTAASINFGSNFSSTGTLQFGGAGIFTLSGTPAVLNNVLVSNSNAAGITPSSNWTIPGNLTINSGAIFNASSLVLTVGGNVINSGTLNSGTSTFILNGASLQNVSGGSAFSNITTNKPSGQIQLLSNATVNGTLTFVSGVIKTSANTLILSSSGSVSGASQNTGWVSGNLKKNIQTGATAKTFEIGDDTYFTPVSVAFSSVTTAGDLTVATTPSTHPELETSTINPAKSVNRFWTLTNNGVVFNSYNATFNFSAADVDAGANTSAFKIGEFDGESWSILSVASPSSTNIQATGVTIMGDFAIGEICNATTSISYLATPYCSNGGTAAVVLTGTAGGTYTSSTGLAVNASSGSIDLGSSSGGDYVVTYTVGASGGCSVFITTANVTVTTAPSATISYPSSAYCSSSGEAAVTVIGSAGGSFSSTSGLILDSYSGLVNLAASTASSYTVTYTIPASGGCSQFSTTTGIAITTQPFATGTYTGNPYCSNGGIVFPTGSAVGLAGTLSSTAGLSIDSSTGAVDLAASLPGTYTVTYSVPASGGCAQYSNTATIAITGVPTATISYPGGPFCSTVTTVPVTFTGTIGGVYSSATGLAVNATTGVISPAASSVGGDYVVTYTMAAQGGCSEQTATTLVTITEMPSATISYPDSPYLAGQGMVQVALTGVPGAGGTYSSTTGLTVDVNSGDINTDNSTGGTFTVTYAVPAGGGCAPYTTTTNVTVYFNVKTWDGGAGTTLWGDAANWAADGVPSSFDDVNLTGSSPILIDVSAIAHNLTVNNASANIIIASGSPMTIQGNLNLTAGAINAQDELTVGGNWVNSGTFTSNNNTVEFNGTIPQTISGTSVTDFYNIDVTNTSVQGVSIESDQNIRGVLTLSANATVDADGSNNTSIVTLKSAADSPTQDAAIGILPLGATITGDMTVERFMTKEGPNSGSIYRYISSPVKKATVADIQDEIPITGSFTGSSTCTGCTANPSMYYYDETIITDTDGSGIQDLNDGYIAFPSTSSSDTLTTGRGYALYVRGNLLSSTSWNVRGPVNTGTTPIALPVTFHSSGDIDNDGWNLVGNPFPSTIDWNSSSGWTRSNLDGSYYVTDNGSGPSIMYATWNGVTGTNGGSQYIAMGQGFWVKANDTPELKADENVKVAGTQTSFFREGSLTNLLRVTLQQNGLRDEAVIHFRDDATRGFDRNADSWKLRNGTFNLSSLAETNEALAINSWSALICSASIKLNVTNVNPGQYMLSFANLDSFDDSFHITLNDLATNKSIPIKDGTTYEFDVTSSPTTFGKERFTITVDKDPGTIDIQERNGVLSVSETGKIKWYYNGELIANASSSTLVAKDPGLYRIDVVDDNGCRFTGTYEYTVTGLEETSPDVLVYPNPVTNEMFVEAYDNAIRSVTVTSIVGKTLDDLQFTSTNEGKVVRFSMGDKASGIYFLHIMINDRSYTKKIIKK